MLLHIILQPPTVYYNTPRGFTTTHIFLTTPGFVLQHLGQNRQHFWQETWAIVLQQWKLELQFTRIPVARRGAVYKQFRRDMAESKSR